MTESRGNNGASTGGRCYATALRKASRFMSQFYDAALGASGIRTTQRAILATVERQGPLTVGALAAALVMDSGGLAHTLKPLIRDGLLSVRTDPSDKRNRLVMIEPAGIGKLRDSDAGFELAQTTFEQAFGEEEAARLRDVLKLLTSERFQKILRDQDDPASVQTGDAGQTA